MRDPLEGMRPSISALVAERTRMEVISNNLANMHTTRTPNGGPYQRQTVIFEAVMGEMNGEMVGKGVRVAAIQGDGAEPVPVYEPGHPDANQQGYVLYPKVDMAREMTDLVTASRAYEANLAAFRAMKSSMRDAVQAIGHN